MTRSEGSRPLRVGPRSWRPSLHLSKSSTPHGITTQPCRGPRPGNAIARRVEPQPASPRRKPRVCVRLDVERTRRPQTFPLRGALGDALVLQLSAHQIATELDGGGRLGPSGWYSGGLLDLAYDLGKRLLPAFDTRLGIPVHRVNLRTGVPRGQGLAGRGIVPVPGRAARVGCQEALVWVTGVCAVGRSLAPSDENTWNAAGSGAVRETRTSLLCGQYTLVVTCRGSSPPGLSTPCFRGNPRNVLGGSGHVPA